MSRTLRAFLWLRWRTTRNTLRGRSRKGRLEEVSRVLSTVLPVVLFFLLIPTALFIAGAGFVGGRALVDPGTSPLHRGWIAVGMRALLFTVLFGIALSPLVRAGYGTGPNVTRLLLLPIRRRALHAAEVLSAFGDPWLAVFVPGLLMLPVGMLSAGAVGPALLVLIATLAFLASVVLISAGLSFFVALLFRRRRRAEWVTLVFITLFSVSGLIVAPLVDRLEDNKDAEAARRAAAGEVDAPIDPGTNASEHLDAALPLWTRAVPSELYVKALTTGSAGDPMGSIGWSAGLVLWTLALFTISERGYGRLLDTPEESSGPRTAGSGKIRIARLRHLPRIRRQPRHGQRRYAGLPRELPERSAEDRAGHLRLRYSRHGHGR